MSTINNISSFPYSLPSKPSIVMMPDWQVVPHKGMKTPPKGELIKQIKELASKQLTASGDEDYEKLSSQLDKLQAQFISAASPDRKTLYRQASNLADKLTPEKPKIKKLEYSKTLVDFLNEHDGIGPEFEEAKKDKRSDHHNKKSYSLACGGDVTNIVESAGGYNYDICDKGETVMSVNWKDKSISYSLTAAERILQNEFNRIYSGALELRA